MITRATGISSERFLPTYSGSYTVAQLATLPAVAGDQTYCSNCLTPFGTGAEVFYDASTSKWRGLTTRIEATTDALTFYRSASAMRLQASGYPSMVVHQSTCDGVSNSLSVTASGTGTYILPQSLTIKNVTEFNTGTTNSGYVKWIQTSLLPSLKISLFSSLYCRRKIYLTALSTSGEEFSYRFGLSAYSSSGALTASEVCLCYDRGNALGFNDTNIDGWLGLSRASSTNTVITPNPVATPSIAEATMDVLELLITSSLVSAYVGGTLVGTAATNIPSTAAMYLNDCLVKSAGTTARSCYANELFTMGILA